MKVSIFYSWQSDLPGKTNRYFIEDAIEKSLKDINKCNVNTNKKDGARQPYRCRAPSVCFGYAYVCIECVSVRRVSLLVCDAKGA